MIEYLEGQYKKLEAEMISFKGRPGYTYKTSQILFEMKNVYRQLKAEREKLESKFYLTEPS